ncbi:MAG TPA: electron transfer flavoprotein beta subunit/FixA family protein [Desulfurella acetivorans]|nr:electron transfer flavoprotein beta subunit/FixA family protein [Desulfurella acetivorans]
MINIGVCIKAVPDYEVPAEKFYLQGNRMSGDYKYVLGLYDEHALEVGLQLRSKLESKLYAISYTKKEYVSTLKKALSMGADELIIIESSNDDPFQTAYNLANIIEKYNIEIAILGRVSSDLEREMVPPLVAGILNRIYLPYIVSISSESNGKSFLCVQQLDNKNLHLLIKEKFVASITDAPCNLPRIPNLKEIMKSKTKPLITEEEINFEKFNWAQELSAKIPKYEYINETLPNDDLSFTAKLLLENLKKEHCL